MIKPWVDPVTASKVKFVNEKELAQIIPITSLPADLGGESTFDFATSYVSVTERQAKSPAPSSTPSSPTPSEDVSSSNATPETTKRRKKKKNAMKGEKSPESSDSSSGSLHDDLLDLEVA